MIFYPAEHCDVVPSEYQSLVPKVASLRLELHFDSLNLSLVVPVVARPCRHHATCEPSLDGPHSIQNIWLAYHPNDCSLSGAHTWSK
eukprot:scaffold21097_cov49-Attheya_sp.AAC.3